MVAHGPLPTKLTQCFMGTPHFFVTHVSRAGMKCVGRPGVVGNSISECSLLVIDLCSFRGCRICHFIEDHFSSG